MNQITKTIEVRHDDQPHDAAYSAVGIVQELLEEAGFELGVNIEYNEEKSRDSVAVFDITLINEK